MTRMRRQVGGGDAHRCLRLFLGVPFVSHHCETPARRLLRLLLLRVGTLPTEAASVPGRYEALKRDE
jgi:hypothetical protein